MRIPTLLSIATAASLFAPMTFADEERVRLAYEAPAACPTRADFERMVLGRTRLARLMPPGQNDGLRAFDVRIVGAAPSHAELKTQERDARKSTRTLDAKTCAEVADGVALIIALAIDPNASFKAAPVPPPPEPAELPPASPPPPRPPVAPKQKMEWTTMALATASFDAAPAIAGGVRVGVEALFAHTRASLFAQTDLSESTIVGHRVDFRRVLAGLELAPWVARIGLVSVAPMIGFDAGQARASADTGATGAHVWLDVALGARLDLSAGPIAFRLGGSAVAPLWRYDVTFEGGRLLAFSVPVVSAVVVGGVVVRFR